MLFLDFKQRYSVLTPKSVGRAIEEGKVTVEKMLKELELDPADYRIGHTKVFFRAAKIAELEERRDQKLSNMIVGLQAYCRGKLARNAFKFHVGDHQAVAIIQRNVRLYMQLKDWKWWKLYMRLKPNLAGIRSEQEAKGLANKVAELTAKMEAFEKDKKDLTDQIDTLKAQLATANEVIDSERESVAQNEALYESANALNQQLTEDLKTAEDDLEESNSLNMQMKKQLSEMEADLKALQEDLANKNVDQARVQRLEKEKADINARLAAEEKRATDAEAKIAALTAENKALKADLEAALAAKAKAEKLAKDAQNELGDLRRDNDQLRSDAASVSRKMRTFDQQLVDERNKVMAIESERDSAQAEMRKQQTLVLKLQGDLQVETERADAAEAGRKKAMDELAIFQDSKTVSATSVQGMESKIKSLEAQLAEVNEECDEQHTEISKLKQEKERLAVELHKLSNIEVPEADAGSRERLQRQVKDLQDQLEEERRSRTKVKNEATKMTLDLKSAQEQLDEMTRLRAKEERDRKRLEKKVTVLTEELHTLTMSGDGGNTEQLKAKNRDLRRKLEETEDALSAANNAKRRAVLDLEESNTLMATLEKEIADLRKSARKLRLEDSAEATSPATRRKIDDTSDVKVERYHDVKYDDDGTVTKITRTKKITTKTHVDEDDA